MSSSENQQKIYFILCKQTGRVKCGIARDVKRRFSCLQIGCPTELHLIAEIDGNTSLEKAIHRRLSQWRVRGEWFQYLAPVREVIIELTGKSWLPAARILRGKALKSLPGEVVEDATELI